MSNIPYDKITNTLIDALQNGTVPWRKPWVGIGPMNAFTKRAYRGINTIVLGLSKFCDPRWATFNQIREHGGSVKKGEKSTVVVFWTFFKNTDKATGKESSVPFLKYFNVFNVEQAEGLNLAPLADLLPNSHDPIEAAEAIYAGYVRAPKIVGSQSAWYRPSTDEVGMPTKEHFHSAEGYYSVLFHELGHSTGHANRLARKEVVNRNHFGSSDYSQEELVAEFTAFFLCNAAGIANEGIEENTTAYLQSWMMALKGDIKMAVAAAGRAQRAADLILGIKQEDSENTSEGVVEEAQEQTTTCELSRIN